MGWVQRGSQGPVPVPEGCAGAGGCHHSPLPQRGTDEDLASLWSRRVPKPSALGRGEHPCGDPTVGIRPRAGAGCGPGDGLPSWRLLAMVPFPPWRDGPIPVLALPFVVVVLCISPSLLLHKIQARAGGWARPVAVPARQGWWRAWAVLPHQQSPTEPASSAGQDGSHFVGLEASCSLLWLPALPTLAGALWG